MVFIRRQVRLRLKRDSLSRSWMMAKRSSYGRSASVASSNEGSHTSPFEASIPEYSKVTAILDSQFAEEVGAGLRGHFWLKFLYLQPEGTTADSELQVTNPHRSHLVTPCVFCD